MSTSELELRLSSLRDELAFPETPALASRIEQAIAAGPPVRRRTLVRPLAIAFAVLVAVVAGVLAFSPGARSAFLEIFNLKGATVELVDELPDVPTTGRLDLGEQVTRQEAERQVGFELLDLGEPDAVFVRDGTVASLVYGDVDNPRLVLSQLRGSVYDGFVKKVGGTGTIVEDVTVRGGAASSSRASSTSSCTSTSSTRSPTSRRTSPGTRCSGTAATCSSGSRAT